MAHKKLNLPTRVCVVCELPFTWRKKWEKNWEDVKYCSDRCRNNKERKRSAVPDERKGNSTLTEK